MRDAIMPDDGARWNTLGCSKEIADLLKRRRCIAARDHEAEFLGDVMMVDGDGQASGHAATTNSSILKLSECPILAPWFDGSRWGFEPVAVPLIVYQRAGGNCCSNSMG